jgi:TRAP-type C4-dicarboxylate transport system substrate-binding protein
MKKISLILLMAVVVASLTFGGCGETTPTEAIKLKYNDQNPETGWSAQHAAKPILREMEEATGGRIEFEEYFGQTLSKGVDAWEATKAGIADDSWCFHGYWPGMTPLADVISLPFIPFESAEQASGIFWQLYEQFPALSAEFDDNKILFVWTSTPYFIINATREIKTMEDLQGLKLRVTGGPPTEMMKLLGVSPVLVGMPDTYVEIQKGVIDGMLIPWEALYTFKQYEVVKYYTYVPTVTVYFSNAMNWDTWNSLPSDIQEEIMSVGGLHGSTFYGKNMFDTIAEEARNTIKDEGYPMIEYTIPPDELERWTEIAGRPLWEEWVIAMEAEGHTEARDILDTMLELTETYHP